MTSGGSEFKKIIGNDRADPRIAGLLRTASMTNGRARMLASLAGAMGQKALARMLKAFGTRSAAAYWDVVRQTIDYREAFAKAMAEANRMDLILLPAFGVPAAPHGASANPEFLGTNTILFNVLGYPAGIVPWTAVRPDEEGGAGLPAWQRKALAGSAGMPFAVQVVARPWREHVALAAMQFLEAAARKRSDYPAKPPL